MKKLAFLLAVALVLALSGCSATQETTTTPAETTTESTTAAETQTTTAAETTTEPTTAAPEAQGNKWGEALKEIYNAYGLDVNLPNLAENVKVSLQTGYAQVDFDFEKVSYTLLIAPHGDDAFPPEGKYENEKECNWLGFEYDVEWSADGTGMAEWDDEATDAEYRLTTQSGADPEKLSELAVILLPTAK